MFSNNDVVVVADSTLFVPFLLLDSEEEKEQVKNKREEGAVTHFQIDKERKGKATYEGAENN